LTFEIVEARAAERAWLEVARLDSPKPIQIGLYMPDYDMKELPT
jgi:hypothetical protein